MKYLIILVVFTMSCSSYASKSATPPTGEEVYDALFRSLNLNLDKEPLCEMTSVSRGKTSISLGDHLATIFSTAHASKNTTTIKSSCSLSKFEDSKGNVTDAWDCSLQVNETNNKHEFISSSTVAFNITLDKKILIPGNLRCF